MSDLVKINFTLYGQSFNSLLPNRMAVPKIASDMTSESKYNRDSRSREVIFVHRVPNKLGCNCTEHFERNFEKAKRTVYLIERIR